MPAALFLNVLGSMWGLLGSFFGVLGQSSGPLGSMAFLYDVLTWRSYMAFRVFTWCLHMAFLHGVFSWRLYIRPRGGRRGSTSGDGGAHVPAALLFDRSWECLAPNFYRPFLHGVFTWRFYIAFLH